jgi:actin-like ATPase involved in cell morphogenesis
MPNRLGIDFGTTTCRIACRRGERSELIPTRGTAREVASRLCGRPSNRTKAALAGQSPIPVAGRFQPPVQVAAQLLHEFGARAAHVLGGALEGAVVTVPAAAGNAQRAATRQAAELAGLGAVRLLNEPTAAAIGYNESRNGSRLLLVYALGAGPLEVAVIAVGPASYDALAVEGDRHISGDAFDRRIAHYFLRQVRTKYGVDVSHSADTLWSFEDAAATAKINLDEAPSTSVPLHIPPAHDRPALEIRLDLDRRELEALLQPEIERSMQVVQTALAVAHRALDEIDEVLLVGGSTRMPLMGQYLHAALERPLVHGSEGLVALGAAAFAAALPAEHFARPQATAAPAATPDPLPAGIQAAIEHANNLLRQNDPKGAVARLDALQPRDVPPGEPLRCVLSCYMAAAGNFLAQESHEDAIRTLDQARTRDKSSADLRAHLEVAYQAAVEHALRRNEPGEAIDLIKRSRVSGAGGAWSAQLLVAAHRLRGSQATAEHQWRKAGDAFAEALRLAPDDAAVTKDYVNVIRRLVEEMCRSGRAKDYTKAAAELANACKLVPGDKQLAQERAKLQSKLRTMQRSGRRS